jgi:hypothetical protein
LLRRQDAPGARHHVICRGIEHRKVFWSYSGREDFIGRLGRSLRDTDTACYAWALLPKHSHLLPRTGNTPIAYRGEAIAAGNDHELVAGRTHKNRGVPMVRPGRPGCCREEGGMIYSSGYQKLDRQTLIGILKAHRAEVLVDVRSRPYGRVTVFNRNAMQRWLPEAGIDYLWKGDVLGGFAAIPNSAIEWLADLGRERIVCIMCMEADPEKCHRKTEIARRLCFLGVEVDHIDGVKKDRPS